MTDSIADQMKLDYMRRSMFSGAKVQPDAEAKAQLLAQKTGLPVDVVREKQPEIEAEDKLNSIDYDGLARTSPKLSTWLIDKSNAAVAHDDLEGLSTIENLISGMGQRIANIASGFYRFVGTTTAPIAEQIEKALPLGTIDVTGDGIKWRPSRPEDFAGAGAFSGTVGFYGEAAETAKYQPGTTLEQVIQSPLSKFFPFAIEQGIISIPDMVAAVTMLPAYISARTGEMGQTRAENDMRQEATVGDLFTVMPFAVASSAMERFGAKGIIGLDEVALTSLKQVPKAVGVAATKEGITEAGQEGIESIAETAYTERGFNLSETGERMLAGVVGGAPFGGFVRGLEGSIEASVNMRKAKQNEQFFQALGDESQKVKLKDRLPDRYRELIDRYTADGPVKEILIPADKFAEYYQSAGIDPAVAAQKAGARNFAEAFASGGDVVVPMSGFMSQIAPSDDLQGLMEDLRLFAGEPTMREAKEAQANMPEMEETLQAEAEKINEAAKQADSLDVAIQRVVSDVEGQLSTRYDTNTAKNMATVMRGIAVLANRAYPNMNPLEASQRMWAKYGLDIQANPLPDVLRDPRNYDVTLDPMLDRLRKGEVPAQSDMYGQSLIEFLREKGGLRDLGGELAARDMDLWDKQNRKKGQKKLVNAKGLDLDHAREIALEAGYDVGADLNTFYAALDKELAGESVFSTSNYDNAAIAQGSSLAELDRALQELGLDLNSMDNESIKRALRGSKTYNAEGTKQFGMAEGEQWDEGEDVPQSFRKQEGLTPEVTEEFDPAMLKFQAFQSAFHGSPYRFDKFTLEHIGKGEGAQAFGWGLYFAGSKEVAEYYRETLSGAKYGAQILQDGRNNYSVWVLKKGASQISLLEEGLLYGQARKLKDKYDSENSGQLYEVNIPEDDTMLLWDKPLSEQSKAVQDALEKFDPDMYSSEGSDYDANETGQTIYLRIADKFRKPEPAPSWTQVSVDTDEHAWSGQEAASKYLNSIGISGIKYLDGTSRGKGEGNYNYVIFDDSAIEILKTYYQNADEKFGSFQILANNKMRINLFENANLSTFIHESGHFYLEVLGDLANDPEASQQVKDDYAKILKFMGVENRADIRVEHHEKFARANEAYMFEGKAPAVELRGVFQRFRAWMKIIYRQLTSLNVKLTDEVREVFDRIYATDAEIERARSEMDTDTVVDAKTLGMTDAEFELYRNAVDSQIGEAKEDLQAKLMKVQKLKTEAWWADELKKMADEVAAEYDALPAAQAFERMATKDSAERLNKQQLIDRYGSDFLKKLPRGYKDGKGAIYSDEGNDLDLTAEIMGFQSGDEMLTSMIKLPPRDKFIAAEADQRMMKKHGDLLNDVALADEAMAAMHNEQRAKVIKIEMRAINKKIREVKPFVKAEQDKAKAELKQEKKERDYERRFLDAEKRTEEARRKAAAMAATSTSAAEVTQRMAQGIITQKQIRDLNPNQYLVAERKANKAAFKAMAKGDYIDAGLKKQQELLNHYLYLEARKAVERADKIAKYANGLSEKKAQERIGMGGEAYLNSINKLLNAYQFKRTTNKQIDLIAALRETVAEAEANGEVIDVITDEKGNIIDPVLLNARNYRELTIDELEALNDMLKNIEHVAKGWRNFRAAERQATFDEIAGKALDELSQGKPEQDIQAWKLRDPRQQKLRAIPLAIAEWRGLFSYIQEAVGFKENSTLWNYVMRPLNAAAAREAVMKRDAAIKLDALFKRYSRTYLYGKGRMIRGFGHVNKQQQLMIAASYGTETGRQRMRDNGLDGRGMTQGQIDAVLDSLDEQDWAFVKELWTLFDSYWQDVSDKQQRVTGVRPQKVDAVPFQTRFGEMPGGYSPIAYESFLDNRAAAQQAAQIADEMKRAAYTSNTTRRGFTKQRLQQVQGKAVRYDFGIIYKHMNEVIHDVTHHEALRDVQKLINHKVDGRSILDEITRRMGYGVRDQITDALEEIAVGDLRMMGSSERIMEHLASGASIAGLAYNVWNAVQNLTGIFNSFAVVGTKPVLRGMAQWMGTPKHMLDTVDMVQQKSEFMRTRYLNMNRDINAMRGKLEQHSGRPAVDDAYAAFRDGGFWMMTRIQQMVDMPTWLGAYDQAKKNDPTMTEENAIALADQAVIAAQGGGRTVDLSKFMRGKGWARVWTVYAGYFNIGYQRALESMKRAKVENYSPAAVGQMVADMAFLLMAPAMMTVIMKQVIDAMVGGDEDDEEEWLKKYTQEQIGYILGMFPFIREATAAVAGYANYGGPVGARFFADVNKFITQIKQGEADEQLVKSGFRVIGTPVGIPTGQIIKTYDGFIEMMDGDATPVALVFGPPKKD